MEATLEAAAVNSVTSLGSVCNSLWRKGEGDAGKQRALHWTDVAVSPDAVEGQQSSASAGRKCAGTSVLT